MHKLKMHPDLGGDTWNAALVNEAYAVLHDPLKREQYDRQIFNRLRKRHSQEAVSQEVKRGHCLFCKSIFLFVPGRAKVDVCLECRSPLQGLQSDDTQIALRRMAARIERTFDITYYTYWPQAGHRAIAMDFSPTGIAMAGTAHFFVGQLVKIECELLNAVAQVKNLETPVEVSGPIRVGLKFVTVAFNLPRGTFVGVTV